MLKKREGLRHARYFFFFSCSFNVWSQYASMSKTASARSAVEYEMHKPCGFDCLLIFWHRPKAEIGGVLPPDDSLTLSHYFIVESHGLLKPQTKSNNLMNRIPNNLLKIPFHGYFVFWLTHNRFIQMYKYNFRFCWPSFTNRPVRHEPVKLHFKNQCTSLSPAGLHWSHGTRRTLLLLSAGKMTSSNRGEVGKAASGVNALGVTDLTAHPPTAWCRWPWAGAGRIHGGGRGEQGEGWRVGGGKGRVSGPEASSAARPLRRWRRL